MPFALFVQERQNSTNRIYFQALFCVILIFKFEGIFEVFAKSAHDK